MMIVIDNEENETPDMINMVDDGKGASITIPSFLISYDDGQKLISEINLEMGEEINKLIMEDPNSQDLAESSPEEEWIGEEDPTY